MKKILYLIGVILFAGFLTSCDKEDAVKDLDNSIVKLKIFNKKFQDFYSDGVISRIKDDKSSEFNQLKDLANEYYESMNKINSQIETARLEKKEGAKEEGYEEAYKKALNERNSEIEALTSEFIENIQKLNEGK